MPTLIPSDASGLGESTRVSIHTANRPTPLPYRVIAVGGGSQPTLAPLTYYL